MTPTAMAYRRPTDFDTALALLASEGSLPLAGGTDFVPMQRSGAINPATIVDLKSLPELRRVEVRDEHVTIGGCVTMAEIGVLGPAGIGALTDGADYVGGRQTRARATLAGNVARSSPAGDTLAPLLALDAVARVAGSGHGGREIALSSFFVGPGQNRLEPGEIITEIVVPAAGSSAYLRLTYRCRMDLAVSGVAVWVRPTATVWLRPAWPSAVSRPPRCWCRPPPRPSPARSLTLPRRRGLSSRPRNR